MFYAFSLFAIARSSKTSVTFFLYPANAGRDNIIVFHKITITLKTTENQWFWCWIEQWSRNPHVCCKTAVFPGGWRAPEWGRVSNINTGALQEE